MTSCNIDESWAAFHYSALIFYGAYGLLCWFVPKWYGSTIYFRNRWDLDNDFHSTDGILWYFMIGAGECCIHMALLTLFMYHFAKPDDNNDDDVTNNWLEMYLIVQVLTWVKWLLTEAYYTYKKVEWVPIGCVHVFLCAVVLAMAIGNYIEVTNKCL